MSHQMRPDQDPDEWMELLFLILCGLMIWYGLDFIFVLTVLLFN
jgi:hypothetical protein